MNIASGTRLGPYEIVGSGRYRPSPDGQRFLVLASLARDAEQPASVVVNWAAALRR